MDNRPWRKDELMKKQTEKRILKFKSLLVLLGKECFENKTSKSWIMFLIYPYMYILIISYKVICKILDMIMIPYVYHLLSLFNF